MSRTYPRSFRESAVREVQIKLARGERGAITHVAEQFNLPRQTLSSWCREEELKRKQRLRALLCVVLIYAVLIYINRGFSPPRRDWFLLMLKLLD